MSMHVIGYELSQSNAALTALTPIPDGTLRVAGNDFFVPPKMNNIVWAAGMINSATATLRGQIQSPSLRATLNIDVAPLANGLVFGSLPPMVQAMETPFPLVENEPLDWFNQNGAAVMNRGFVCLADGPLKQVGGKVYTVRATLAITLATATWANGALTLAQTLPAGVYQVVGCRVWSANSVAYRIFFVGSAFRPGGLCCNAEANLEWPWWRYGGIGVWDQFNNIVPPSFDVMGITDTSEVVYLDLIKVQ